jgi:hypothetical protein
MTLETRHQYMEQQVDGMLQALPSLQAFDPLQHVNHLHSYINVDESNYKKRIEADLYYEDLDSRHIDIWGKKQGDLERFKCMTIGWGMRGHSAYNSDQAIAPVRLMQTTIVRESTRHATGLVVGSDGCAVKMVKPAKLKNRCCDQ